MKHQHIGHGIPVNKIVLGPSLLAYVIATTLTWKDLRTQPENKIWGTKKFWYVASGANLLGSIGYWLVGRDKSVHSKMFEKVEDKIVNKVGRK